MVQFECLESDQSTGWKMEGAEGEGILKESKNGGESLCWDAALSLLWSVPFSDDLSDSSILLLYLVTGKTSNWKLELTLYRFNGILKQVNSWITDK